MSPMVSFTTDLNVTARKTKHVCSNTIEVAPELGQMKLRDSRCTFTPTTKPRAVPSMSSPEVASQAYATDHMLKVRWTEESGWDAPEIVAYDKLSLWPTASVLHYATECFEGLKTYRGYDGKARLFRPERNARRFIHSATRVGLPQFCPEEFIKLLKRYVAIEAPKWMPTPGQFVYIRPTMIATNASLGARKPQEALMYIIMVLFPNLNEESVSIPTSPAPSHLTRAKPSKGMKLLASEHGVVRAWPNGCGNAKVGANYGPALPPHSLAQQAGYDQVLWLFGEENYITEAGGSNLFVLWTNTRGQKELITAPLTDQLILEGITRASVLESASTEADVVVSERKFTMTELIKASDEGRLLEVFATGTAFFVAPVAEIRFRGQDITLPLSKGQGADFALGIRQELSAIMYGERQHEWGIVVEEGD